MRGFLQRLAERATGVLHPVRAVSAAPFAPALFLADESQQTSDHAVASDAALEAHVYPAVAATPAAHQRDQTATPKFDPRPAPVVADVDQTATPCKMIRRFTAASEPGKSADAGPAIEMPPPIMPLADGKARHRFIETDLGLGAQFRSPGETPVGQSTSPRPALDAMTRVEPLLPLVRDAGRPAPTGDHQGRASFGMIEETTEVHVTIGRIEVTAIHEPAPSQPTAPRRKPPMSLDDYLTRRQGGRS